jgi:general secretion pathway protein G
MLSHTRRAFTIIEILVIVVILGIMAAIVTPKLNGATNEAAAGTAMYELEKLRRALEVYQARWSNQLPPIEAGDGTWGPLVGSGDYLKTAPQNPYVGGSNRRVITLASEADTAYQTNYGWIFDPVTGQVWAGGFDINDQPLTRN